MLPLCDFYLGVHDVICAFPIYGPPHLSPGILQESEEDLTGQNKVLSWEERTIVRYCKAGTESPWLLCFPVILPA